jgi:hypothetical protein
MDIAMLGWVFAAGATGLAVGLYLARDREQEQVVYLRGQLREVRGTPENVKALNPPATRSGGGL